MADLSNLVSSGLSGFVEVGENDNYPVHSQAQAEQTGDNALCREDHSPFTRQNRRFLCSPPYHGSEFHSGLNFPITFLWLSDSALRGSLLLDPQAAAVMLPRAETNELYLYKLMLLF